MARSRPISLVAEKAVRYLRTRGVPATSRLLAREVLALCPSDEIEAFQRNVLLVGGGARVLGLASRVQEELRADGFDFVRVHAPEQPSCLVARGAYLWAQSLEDDDWSIPLFSFAG